ncbi:hypothetical protein O6H91_12G065200 [Diphasiastrum complanatum]|nr:hypothetical protein O6H91_12G065200 [Diphasiastrum complanatum]
MLLVYEYMANRSLDKVLFGGGSVLGWQQRYKVVKGVAAGLAYLHEGWEKRVLHRDVKPSNVLLDQEFEPRIADFGLARLIEHSNAGKTMTVAGTLGYVAPELHYTGRATDRSDVYSFGILLLAVASGREAMDKRLHADQEKLLLNWVWRIQESGDLLAAVDMRLEDAFDEDEVRRVLQLGLLCCFPDPEARPPMRFCEQILHGDASIPNLPSSKPPLFYPLSFSVDLGEGRSFMLGSSSASASISAPAVISDYTTSEFCSSKPISSATSASSDQQKFPIIRSSSADFVRKDDADIDYHMPLIRYRSLKET